MALRARRRCSSSMPSMRGILMSSTARSTGRAVSALQGAFAVGVGADLEAFLLQGHRDAGQDVAVVIDQGDGLLHRGLFRAGHGVMVMSRRGSCSPSRSTTLWHGIVAHCGRGVNEIWHCRPLCIQHRFRSAAPHYLAGRPPLSGPADRAGGSALTGLPAGRTGAGPGLRAGQLARRSRRLPARCWRWIRSRRCCGWRGAAVGISPIRFAAGPAVRTILGRRSDVSDLAVMGRSFHWMDRAETLRRLEGLIAPRGRGGAVRRHGHPETAGQCLACPVSGAGVIAMARRMLPIRAGAPPGGCVTRRSCWIPRFPCWTVLR